jgi:3-methyladenine DNA glycosylase AlkD
MFMASSSIERKIIAALTPFIEEEKTRFLPRFFMALPGGYGEGDRFLGVRVPSTRKVAKAYGSTTLDEIALLLHSPWHEVRLCALFILVERYRRTDDKKSVVDFYLSHLQGVNNWDLVDSSAPQILGEYLKHNSDRSVLYEFAASENLWKRRIGIVATQALLRDGQYDDTLNLAAMLLDEPHDLVRKATGWMLRELGKKAPKKLEAFLQMHAAEMPRMMLRYAIEKLDKHERRYFLDLKSNRK